MKYDDAAAIGRIIARLLQERREEKGYSYRRLEKKTGLDRRYLTRIETGEINPTVISGDLEYDIRVLAREQSQLRSEDGLRRKSRT